LASYSAIAVAQLSLKTKVSSAGHEHPGLAHFEIKKQACDTAPDLPQAYGICIAGLPGTATAAS